MRILGIDYGHKRIGLAVSDESQTFARELSILSPKIFWEKLNDILLDHQIEQIVVGLPLNMSGGKTEKTREVEQFISDLEAQIDLPVETMDERLTSAMAAKISGSQKNLDSLAAQILLQNYLDKTKSV